MKTVALEAIMADTIVSFLENAAELGCPKDQEVDMWFRYLTPEDRLKVMDKLIYIEDRDAKRFKEDQYVFGFCPKCSNRKMDGVELVGCKKLSNKQWESGFEVDIKKHFGQKNCPLLKGKNEKSKRIRKQ